MDSLGLVRNVKRSVTGGVALLLTGAVLTGCVASEEPSVPVTSGTPTVGPDASAPPATTLPPPTQTNTNPIVTSPTPPVDGGVNPSPSAASGMPCAVQAIVAAKCAKTCHADPPVGSPTSLTKQSHWQQLGNSDKTKKYFELAKTRINATNNPMPPIVSDQLTAAEKTTLNNWLNAGAPASNETCAVAPPSADAGVPNDPTKVDTTGLECHKFLAHAPGSKTAKYKVGTAVDKYLFFGFQAPWTSPVYGLVVKPVTDNAKVLHHWILYREEAPDGSVEETIGQHTGGEMIHGWAPGGIAMDFRKHDDVSFELQPGSYGLELHYNSSDPNAEDMSGAEVCYTKTKTKNIAAMSWLGYDQGGILSYGSGGALCLEAATSWTGTCRPVNHTQPINLIFMTPHLHQTGRNLKSIINMPGGKTRVLHDKPFDFNYQVTYETKEVLMPGETITTTCTFSEPKCAGQATSQEMCYNFVYAYPAGALIDNGPEGTLMHGKGVCLGQ